MRNIKLKLSYDGTEYVGWQVQPNGRSVQALLQDAIGQLVQSKVDVIASGRTDAGVHAIEQVAHVRIDSTIPPDGIMKGANSILPQDIAIVDAEEADLNFHALRDAQGKQYRYRMLYCKQRVPLLNNRAWRIKHELDIELMKKASSYLVGKHDYESFRASGCTASDAVRTITSINYVIPSNDSLSIPSEGRVVDIIFEGDGFVRHMIRNIVGTLVEVGLNNISPDEVKSILEKKNRQEAYRCAPACALYLVKVYYTV
ncbi:MAG: tRNA pseudouridine(38-40) synthase TruA [Deltaproteobacteria bacterium]|jgi:tRNA pseudouridine38-40 synthase|nr:tRNA pseudouridine(38-40) synthase TruA [Deltaproteobacteria bacterium]